MIKGKEYYYNFYIQQENESYYIVNDNFEKIMTYLNKVMISNNKPIYLGIYYEHKNVDFNRIKGYCPLVKIENNNHIFLDTFKNNNNLLQEQFFIHQIVQAIQYYIH